MKKNRINKFQVNELTLKNLSEIAGGASGVSYRVFHNTSATSAAAREVALEVRVEVEVTVMTEAEQ